MKLNIFYMLQSEQMPKIKKENLAGFYEKPQIVPDSHGRLKSLSEKVELVRPERQSYARKHDCKPVVPASP